MNDLVSTIFFITFIINLLIFLYALNFGRKEGFAGYLSKSVLFAGLSSLVFSVHHVMEALFQTNQTLIAVSEAVEGVAAFLLVVAVVHLYRLVSD